MPLCGGRVQMVLPGRAQTIQDGRRLSRACFLDPTFDPGIAERASNVVFDERADDVEGGAQIVADFQVVFVAIRLHACGALIDTDAGRGLGCGRTAVDGEAAESKRAVAVGGDRESGGWGKGGSVRVDRGG